MNTFTTYTLLAYIFRNKSVFVESLLFKKLRSDYLSDHEYHDFQCELLNEPTKGDVIQGTGGLRKSRFSSKGKGKRGAARVIYYHFDKYNRFYLLTIYAKNEMSDLTTTQKKQLNDFMEAWKNEQA